MKEFFKCFFQIEVIVCIFFQSNGIKIDYQINVTFFLERMGQNGPKHKKPLHLVFLTKQSYLFNIEFDNIHKSKIEEFNLKDMGRIAMRPTSSPHPLIPSK